MATPTDDCTLTINLGAAALILTKALDYVGIDDYSHGRRVGLMCHRAAHRLGWDQDTRHTILLAGMLHDIGVSSTGHHQKLVDEIEWSGADVHCDRGQRALSTFGPFRPYATAVRHHHHRWAELPKTLSARDRDFANLIFLADRLDVFYCRFLGEHPHHDTLNHKQEIFAEIEALPDELFAPHLVAAMRKAAQSDGFWLELHNEFLDDAITETLNCWDHNLTLTFGDIQNLAELISQVVDAKSPFTHDHSRKVADLTYQVAKVMGFDDLRCKMLRIAGLLHDVGKLRTPDDILEKAGKLSSEEFARIRSHPMDSKRVMSALFPGSPMVTWVAQHHEKLDGTGYPFGWTGEMIPIESRILAVCDIFQALSQERPYRGILPLEKVMEILDDMNGLDQSVLEVVRAHAPALYDLSIEGYHNTETIA